jgi:hypothetical protein
MVRLFPQPKSLSGTISKENPLLETRFPDGKTDDKHAFAADAKPGA